MNEQQTKNPEPPAEIFRNAPELPSTKKIMRKNRGLRREFACAAAFFTVTDSRTVRSF